MNELLHCALHRLGAVSTASEIHDKAVALALDANWPRDAIPKNVHVTSATLRAMVGYNVIRCTGSIIEDGKPRPTYAPLGEFLTILELPEPPTSPVDSARMQQHPLDTLSAPQLQVLFDTFRMSEDMHTKQRREREELAARQDEERERVHNRIMSKLVAAGMTKA